MHQNFVRDFFPKISRSLPIFLLGYDSLQKWLDLAVFGNVSQRLSRFILFFTLNSWFTKTSSFFLNQGFCKWFKTVWWWSCLATFFKNFNHLQRSVADLNGTPLWHQKFQNESERTICLLTVDFETELCHKNTHFPQAFDSQLCASLSIIATFHMRLLRVASFLLWVYWERRLGSLNWHGFILSTFMFRAAWTFRFSFFQYCHEACTVVGIV